MARGIFREGGESGMFTVSLVMIARGGGKALSRCLDSVRPFADEIVVVFPWDAAKRLLYGADAWNLAFSKAGGDAIFWMEERERVTAPGLEKLLALKTADALPADAVYMLTDTGYSPRLVKRENRFTWFEPAHEYLLVWGAKRFTDIVIQADGPAAPNPWEADLERYDKMAENQESFSPRAAFYYARALDAAGREEEAAHWHGLFLESGEWPLQSLVSSV